MSTIKSKENDAHVVLADDLIPFIDNAGTIPLSVTADQIKDFIHAGKTVFPSYDLWTGNHNYQGRSVFGPTANDVTHSFSISSVATFLTNPGGTDSQAVGGPLAIQLIVEDAIGAAEYFAMGVIGTIRGSTEDNLDPLQPFNLGEFGMVYAPASNGGLESTLLESRGVDYDFNIQSGTINTIHGTTARCRYTGTATVDKFVGHKTVGPNQAATTGTLTDYIGFLASWEDRVGATGQIEGDFIGVQIDANEEIHPDMTVVGEQIGVWLNGTQDLNGDKGVAFVIGKDKGSKIFRSAIFGSNPKLVIETDNLEIRDSGSSLILPPDAGATAPIPVFNRLPATASNNQDQTWIKVLLGTAVFYIPAFAHN